MIEDLKAWRRTIDALPNPIHQVFYQFILPTGLRKTEAFTLEWKHLHDDRTHLPMVKNGRPFDLRIVQRHLEILEPVRGLNKQWSFPRPSRRRVHWETCPAALESHAHRRTFATVAMEAGVLEEILGCLLNQTPKSITGQRYTKPSFDALRPAMQTLIHALVSRGALA